MESTVNERIEILIKSKAKNVSEFERSCKLKRGALTGTLNRGMKPKLETVQSILTCYNDINSDWLIHGTGEMLRSDKEKTQEDESLLRQTLKLLQEELARYRGREDFFIKQLGKLNDSSYRQVA